MENCTIKAAGKEEKNHSNSTDRMTPSGKEQVRGTQKPAVVTGTGAWQQFYAELIKELALKRTRRREISLIRQLLHEGDPEPSAVYIEALAEIIFGVKYKRSHGNVLPSSAKDLENSPAGANSLETFLGFVFRSVIDIPAQFHCAMLILCSSFLSYQGKTVITPFVSNFENSTNDAPQLLLSFGEAFPKFFPEMIHITEFILCYVLTSFLAWPLQVAVQIFVVLLLIYAPFRFFPEIVHKASGVSVASGSFKLPLFWFTAFGAVGLSLICVLLTLLVIYIRWRCIHEGSPKVKELLDDDDLSEILDVV